MMCDRCHQRRHGHGGSPWQCAVRFAGLCLLSLDDLEFLRQGLGGLLLVEVLL